MNTRGQRNRSIRNFNALTEPLEKRLLMYSGNVLVGTSPNGNDGAIREYSLAGSLLRSVNVPANGADGSVSRDLQVDPSGNVQLWTGTFSPVLQRTGPLIGGASFVKESSSVAVPGWSTINRTFYGGVAVVGQYVFASDQETGSGGGQRGLIRFDSKNNYAATRFGTDSDFSDVTIGMDGKLYAINGGQTSQAQVKVFDPLTLAAIRTVNVPGFDDASVAADSSGNIYVGGFSDGKIWKLSPTGTVLKSVDIAAKDLDMSSDNQLLTSDGAMVRLLDTNLNTLASFPATSFLGATFVAFSSYQSPPGLKASSFSGTVFSDTDGNGGAKQPNDPALAGRIVYIDDDKDGMQDPGEKNVSTDGNGVYHLTGLARGTYRVRRVVPDGFRITTPTAGFYDVTVGDAQNVTGFDLGAAPTPTALPTTLRINAGGPAYTGTSGNVWQADTGFTGGTTSTASFAVAGTSDDALLYARRFGNSFTFSKPIANGTYRLRLLFAESYFTSIGQRKFDVFAEGQRVLDDLDLVAAGGSKSLVLRDFTVSVTDQKIDLSFVASVDNAIISAIEMTSLATTQAASLFAKTANIELEKSTLAKRQGVYDLASAENSDSV